MRKIYYAILINVILLSTIGCNQLSNTPAKKVETFFKKYQTLDVVVLEDLDESINNEIKLNGAQKTKYRDIMKKQYQNLSYNILKTETKENNSTVKVEIIVLNFREILDNAEIERETNETKFYNELGEYDETKYMDYRLEKLKEAKNKVKYTAELTLTKINDEWIIDDPTVDILNKITGTYTN